MVNTIPRIDSPEITALLNAALARGETSIRATYWRTCPVCGQPEMLQDGVLATGLPLGHYTPEFGEVLKNHAMVCRGCGFEQGS